MYSRAEIAEWLRIAVEALGRYKLRTLLSVLGVVLGVGAVIAMMSVSEGAARQALGQVHALGLDNLVARSQHPAGAAGGRALSAADADRALQAVPFATFASPLRSRQMPVGHDSRAEPTVVFGVRPAFGEILRLAVDRGRFLTAVDEERSTAVCVLGGLLSRTLFAYRDPLGARVRLGRDECVVAGVLRVRGSGPAGTTPAQATMAWHDVDRAVFVPLSVLSGRTLAITPDQPADEIWLQVSQGERAAELGDIFARVLARTRPADAFTVVVPRELLAQRYRTQRTFAVVVGSVAVLALLVGGIGIMNIMLMSVVERTKEIGVRRTVGATRRDVMAQFLVETILVTVSGGVIGVAGGVVVSQAISSFAGWATHVSVVSVLLGLTLALAVGLLFGWYPAIKAGDLQPVDAMRYE